MKLNEAMALSPIGAAYAFDPTGLGFLVDGQKFLVTTEPVPVDGPGGRTPEGICHVDYEFYSHPPDDRKQGVNGKMMKALFARMDWTPWDDAGTIQ